MTTGFNVIYWFGLVVLLIWLRVFIAATGFYLAEHLRRPEPELVEEPPSAFVVSIEDYLWERAS